MSNGVHKKKKLRIVVFIVACVLTIMTINWNLVIGSEKDINAMSEQSDFTNAELKCLNKKNVLTVCTYLNIPPIEVPINKKNSSKKAYTTEVLNYIQDNTGITFKIVNTTSLKKALKLLETGEVDMVAGFYTSNNDKALNYKISDAYFSMPMVIVGKESLDIQAGVTDKIGYTYIDDDMRKYLKDSYPNVTFMKYEDSEVMLNDVNSGDLQLAVCNFYTAQQIIGSGRNSLTILDTSNFDCMLNFIFSKTLDADIVSIINKSINNLSKAEKNNFLINSFISFENRMDFYTIFFALLACIFAFLLYLVYEQNYFLKQNKNKLTQALEIQRKLKKEKVFRKASADLYNYILEVNISNNIFTTDDELSAHIMELELPYDCSYEKYILEMGKNIIHPQYSERYLEAFSRDNIMNLYKNNKMSFEFTCKERSNSGEYVWIYREVKIYQDEDNASICILVFVRNVTEQKKKELLLEKQNEFVKAANDLYYCVYEFNLSENLAIKSTHLDRLEGQLDINDNLSLDEIIDVVSLKLVHPDNKEEFLKTFNSQYLINQFLKGNNQLFVEYKRFTSNRYIWVSSDIKLYYSNVSNTINAFVYVTDINERKLYELSLLETSKKDAFTQLLDKEHTKLEIDNYLSGSNNGNNKNTFLLFDIDNFKGINDEFGHAAGDSAVKEFAKCLTKSFRNSDIIGRIGGDEFVVLMKNCDDEKIINKRIEFLKKALKEADSIRKEKNRFNLNASIGISLSPEYGTNFLDLYHYADLALYYIKKHGKNNYYIYNKK